MHVRRILVTSAVALGAVLTGSAPAGATPVVPSALPSPVRVIAADEVAAADAHCSASLTTVSRDGGAMVCFNPTGEHLYVCDLKADGHHPGVEYSIDEAPTKQADYDLTANYCHDLNLSMSEHSHVTYWAINYEGAAELSISEPITASAAG